jgi:hypothetical protein
MKKFFQRTVLWIFIKVHSFFLNLGIAMRNEEMDNLDVDERKKFNKRWIRSQLLQKFEQGQRDEKYVQDYYELLKKADKFMLEASAHQKAVAADRWGMNVGVKDKYGRRYDHLGFFDGKHKHHGKTMKEVLEAEMEERRTKDDDYELLGIVNNEPIQGGLSSIDGVVDDEFKMTDLAEKSKTFVFPIKITRPKDVANKLEQLAESMHIKKIGFEHRQLEFFIPNKYGVDKITEDDPIFKELMDINEVYVKDKYGETVGFAIHEFSKRMKYKDTHEVWKFHAIEMQTITMR